MDEVIAAKFDPPVWMGDQLRRDGLLERLGLALSHRLTLIHAPAGYGKTSLLAQWRMTLETAGTRFAWLTLDRDDRDFKRFLRHLVLAIRTQDQRSQSDTPTADLPPRAALSALVNGLASRMDPFVLILDDLHHAASETVIQFVKSLIRLAPSNCHFVFASRDYPWLGQSVLAAEDQLLEFTARDLKFSMHEAGSLLARADSDLIEEDVGRIVDRTEGWPIAVQLTSLSLKHGVGQEQFMASTGRSGGDLARYLSEQVLMTLPDDTRDIVSRTALLDTLTGDLVNLLCDREDGWLVLERLEQQGVFLAPVTPERRQYRYHQLFADYLRDGFRKSDKATYCSLQKRAADWFASHNCVADAVNHAVLADDPDTLARILEDAGGWRLIPQGLQSVVEQGLEKLPEHFWKERPKLVLAYVYLQMKLGELGVARVVFDQFVEAIDSKSLSADLATEVRVVGDTLSDYENQPVTFEDLLAREALLRKLPTNDHLIFANVSETLAAKYFEGGWFERALQPTLVAREHYQACNSLYSDLFTRFLEARIKRAQGRFKEAETILEQACETIISNFGDRSDLAANCYAFQAELLYEQDRTEEAQVLLAWALPHMEQSDGWVDVYAAAYFTEARALAGCGEIDEALAVIARAKRTAQWRRLRQLELLADTCEVELLIAHGPSLDLARQRAARMNLDGLADMMGKDSPQYRPVAVAASLCRIKLHLLDRAHDAALAELESLRMWADQRGAGRLLIEINILSAYACRRLGDLDQARMNFDEAVGIAMFQNIIRPFAEASRFVRDNLDDAMSADNKVDKFRGQFLKSVSRSVSACRADVAVAGPFNAAEAEVLFYLSQGHSNKEIARLIGMSPDTVKYRLKSVFKKIGVSKRKDAVRVSAERGLIPNVQEYPSLTGAS